MLIPAWISFIIAITIAMVLSKKDLGIGLFLGAILFAILAEVDMIQAAAVVFLSFENLLLGFTVFLIPILGGLMQRSKLMIDLIDNMNVSKRTALMISPAMFGLLPIAGGALMSAPLVEEVGSEVSERRKVVINVWFRHVLILVYPLQASLIVASEMAGLSLYTAIGTLLIPCFIMIVIGYFTLVRPIETEDKEERDRNLKIVLRNIFPLILAPLIDIVGRYLIVPIVPGLLPEMFMLIGLIISIFTAIRFSAMGFKNIEQTSASEIKVIMKDMSIWKYPVLIYAIFFFLEVFKNSSVPSLIASLELNFYIFLVIAFLLGFATGRVQLPITILIPIYLGQYGFSTMPLFMFSLLYCAVFLGYVITPVHPCVAYSLNYYKIGFKDILRGISLSTGVCFIILIIVYAASAVF